MNTQKKLPDSRFYMWRSVFALVHTDGVIAGAELTFLYESTKDLPLSDDQRSKLNKDLSEPQDVATMFAHITDARDRAEFFVLARMLCWSDGDYDAQERNMMKLLDELNVDRDADALLSQSKLAVQEIRLNSDQWVDEHAEERSVFAFFKRLLGF